MAEPKRAFEPRLYSSTQPYSFELKQPYNASANRRPTYIRFLYAFALAAWVWYAGATFLRFVVHFFPWREPYPIPPHVTLENCVPYDEWSSLPDRPKLLKLPLAAVTTFDLSLSAETLLLLSRGPQSGGSVEIVTSPEQDQDEVKSLQRMEDSVWGLSLFSRLRFATKIIFPELSDKSPLLVKKLETDVHKTVHRVGDLNEKILFQSLHLKASNGPIVVQSVKADQGTFESFNGGISGVFNTSSLLILTATNGRVQTDIGLSNINGSEPKLVLANSNGAVESRISLISEKGIGGSFDVTTRTSNGRLDIEFPAGPPDSILKLGGKTSNAGVSVSLNPSYEGSFLLETSDIFKPKIIEDKTVVDPSGRNRKRSLKIKQEKRKLITGEIFWDDAIEQVSKATGSICLRTSNGNIDLNL